MTDIRFNAPEHLPPVGCQLLIKLPDGTVLKVRRTSHIQTRDSEMEYECEDGTIITGRHSWTYP